MNFRSPQLCVAWLNRDFGYDMYAASDVVDVLKVVHNNRKELENLNPNALVLCFFVGGHPGSGRRADSCFLSRCDERSRHLARYPT